MGRTAKYEETANARAARGPWVLLQAWPSPAVVPIPVGAPFGRDHLAQFAVEDTLVSSAHCELRVTPGGLSIADLGSTNGTWLDGRRIESAVATEGSVVRAGESLFVVRRSNLRAPVDPIIGGAAGDLVAPFGLAAVRNAVDGVMRTGIDNVLVTGETGTGKEALARHVALRRNRDEPFEAVNCAAYRTASFDAAFFGHERGAFTGADAAHAGVVGAAEGGTLFLDELGDMPVVYQPLLLRFLETREVRRVGALSAKRASVLVVAATNRDLAAEVEAGAFRADLWARFGAPHLHLPPLRERPEDIPAIAAQLAARAGWKLDEEADVAGIERLMLLPLPRNVRELRAVIESAYAAGGVTGAILDASHPLPSQSVDADAIAAALRLHGSERKAAAALGISRRQIRNALAGSRTSEPGPRSGERPVLVSVGDK